MEAKNTSLYSLSRISILTQEIYLLENEILNHLENEQNIDIEKIKELENKIEKKYESKKSHETRVIEIRNTYKDKIMYYNKKAYLNNLAGKISECIIYNRFKLADFDVKIPDPKNSLELLCKNNEYKTIDYGKYIDLTIDEFGIEIKCICGIEFKCETKNNKVNAYFQVLNKFKDIIHKLKSIKYQGQQNSKYLIVNCQISKYTEDENKWCCTNNILDIYNQTLFCYNLFTNKIVYINKNSFLFNTLIKELFENNNKVFDIKCSNNDEYTIETFEKDLYKIIKEG